MRKTARAVHICSFTAVNLEGRDRYDYEQVKAAVLKAGRFSIFEATENDRSAAVYARLDEDPDLEVRSDLAEFPWLVVRPRTTTGSAT